MKTMKLCLSLVMMLSAVFRMNIVHADGTNLVYTTITDTSMTISNYVDVNKLDNEGTLIGESVKEYYFDQDGKPVINVNSRATVYKITLSTKEYLYDSVGVYYSITATSTDRSALITKMTGTFKIEDYYDDTYITSNINKTQSGNYTISYGDYTMYIPPVGVQLYACYNVRLTISNGVTAYPTLDDRHALKVL